MADTWMAELIVVTVCEKQHLNPVPAGPNASVI